MQGEVLVAGAVAVIVLYLPGAIALLGARLPLALTLAAAPAVSLFLADLGGRAASLAGMRWSGLWLLGPAVLLGLALAALTRVGDRPRPERWWSTAGTAFVVVMVLAAAALGLSGYASVSQGFTIVPQDFDPTFHANAIRWIADTGVATSDGLSGMDSVGADAAGYYPMALHALAALVFDYTGLGVVVAYHATISAWFFMLPLGAAALAGALRLGAPVAGGAALVSTAFTSLPWGLLWRGLLPFGVTLVLATAVLALLVHGMQTRGWGTAAAFACASAGLVAAHTSAVMTLGVLGLGLVMGGMLGCRDRRPLLGWLLALLPLLGIALLPTLLSLDAAVAQAGAGGATDWPAVQSGQEAVRSALGFGTGYRDTIQLRLSVLVWFGVVASLLPPFRRALGALPGMAMGMGLFVLAAAFDNALSLRLTTFWWNDQVRLGALAATLAPVFVGTLLGAVVWSARRLWARRPATMRAAGPDEGRRWGRPIPTGLAVLLAVALAAGAWAGGLAVARERGILAVTYMYYDGPPVSRGEVAALERLSETAGPCHDLGVPPSCAVMNDPADGSPWMLALAGVRPVFAQAFPPDPSTDRGILAARFDELGVDSAVRQIARDHGLEYAYVAEGFTLGQGPRAEGLDALDGLPEVFEQVWRSDSAALYRVRWDLLPPP